MQPIPIPARLAPGEVMLPGLIGSGMVLQRDVELNIWGWAVPGETVAVEFCDERPKVTANEAGEWIVKLRPRPAGGPYSMTIFGKTSLHLTDIYVGDVWLAAGQSNMELGLAPLEPWKGVPNHSQEIVAANFPRIRLLRVATNAAAMPQQDVLSTAGWAACCSLPNRRGSSFPRRPVYPIGEPAQGSATGMPTAGRTGTNPLGAH